MSYNPNNQPVNDLELQAAREDAYTALNGLLSSGMPLDGPNLTRAGLGYEERLRLGYMGSIDPLVEDAAAWQAEQDEQQRQQGRHAATIQHANEEKAEADAASQARQAAEARVASLMDGSAAVNSLSYKEKLEQGGELGMHYLKEHSRMSRDAAIARADEEGYSVAFLQPRHAKGVNGQVGEVKALAPSRNSRETIKSVDESDVTGRDPELVKAATLATLEIRNEDLENLQDLRDKYVTLLAGRGRRSLTFGEYSRRSVEQARNTYEAARDDLIAYEKDRLQKLGVSEELIEKAVAVQSFQEQRDLARALRGERLVATGSYEVITHTNDAGAEWTEVAATQKGFLGRQMNKFYNWFDSVNNGGKWYSKGAMQKGAVVAGVGLVTGAVVGTVLAPVAGTAAAGAAGVLLANRVTKAYMSARLHRKAADSKALTHADARQGELFKKLGDGTGNIAMVNLIEGQTKKEVTRNRVRVAKMGAIALAGGGLVWLADGLFGGGGGGHAGHPTNPGEHTQAPGNQGNNNGGHGGNNSGHHGGHKTPEHHGKTGGFEEHVQVEQGHGYTQELQDLFRQKGIELNGKQSFSLYDHLVDKFPNGHFFTNNPSYVRPQGDFGISRPGFANWAPQVLEEINRYAQENNLS